MSVHMLIEISEHFLWVDRNYVLRAESNDEEYFRQSIINNSNMGFYGGDYGVAEVYEVQFTSPITRSFEGEHSDILLQADSEGFCVIRAILKCMESVSGYKTWKFDKIKKQFNDLFGDSIRHGINAKQIEEWIKHYSIKANLYAISPDGKVCLQYIYRGNTHGNKKVIIPLLVNNNHANIIEDQEIINVLKTSKANNINNLIKW